MYIKKAIRGFVAGLITAGFILGSVSVYAANQTSASTEVSFLKGAEYTLSVPATTTITFGSENTDIGDIVITGTLASDKVVKVTAIKNEFTSNNGHFDFNLLSNGSEFTEATWNSSDASSGKKVGLTVNIPKLTWDEVRAGDYSGSITFKAEVQ